MKTATREIIEGWKDPTWESSIEEKWRGDNMKLYSGEVTHPRIIVRAISTGVRIAVMGGDDKNDWEIFAMELNPLETYDLGRSISNALFDYKEMTGKHIDEGGAR